jgi:PAS domain S-box-containing protein
LGKEDKELFYRLLLLEVRLARLSSEEELIRVAAEEVQRLALVTSSCFALLSLDRKWSEAYFHCEGIKATKDLVADFLSFIGRRIKLASAFFRKGEPKRFRMDSLPSRWRSFFSSIGVVSLFAIPLGVPDREIGVIFLGLSKGYKLSSWKKILLRTLGDYISLVVENFRRRREIDDYLATLEEKVAERTKELASSEERYRNLVEHSLDGIYIIQDDRLLYVNDELCRIFGYSSPEEIIGHDCREFVAEESLKQVEDQLGWKQQGKPGKARHVFRAKRRDGRVFDAEVFSAPVMYQGRWAVQGSVREVTEREQLLRKLKESEERYRNLFDNASDIIFLIDKEGRFIDGNKAAERLSGYHREELLGEHFSIMVFPEDREKAFSMFKKTLSGKMHIYSIRMRRKDGEIRVLEINASPVIKEGEIIGSQGVARDITERERLIVRLRESEERYRNLFDNARDIIFIVDKEGKLSNVNKVAEEISGYRRQELIGKHFSAMVFPEEREKAFSQFRETLNGDIHTRTIRMMRKDGKPRVLEISSSPLIRDGEIVGSQGVARDITEREEFVAELKREKGFRDRLIDTANALVVGLDLEGRVVIFNRKCEELTGYSQNEVIGGNWFEIFLPVSWQNQVYEVFSQLKKGILPSTFENPIVTKNGEERIIFWHNTVIEAEKGEPQLILAIGEDITEQELLKRKLVESERRHRELFERAVDPIFLLDTEARFIDGNPAAEEISGYTKGELLGKPFSVLLSPEEGRKASSRFQRLLSGKSPIYHGRCELIRKDGKRVPVEVRSTVILREGKPVGILGIARDVSRRERLERLLKETSERLESLLENTPASVIITDRQGVIQYTNPAAEQLYGYSKDELLGKHFSVIVPEPGVETVTSLVNRVLSGEALRNIEAERITKQGEARNIILTLSPIKDHEGAIIGIAGITKDITEKKKLEEKLRESEERYRILFEYSGTAVAVIEPDGTYSLVNRRFEELVGRKKKEIEDKLNPCDIIHPDDKERCLAQRKARMRGEGVPTKSEFRMIRPDGEVRDVVAIGEFIPGTKRFIVSLIDITERKELEARLKRSEKMASLGQLSAGIVHEINNPLSFVLSNFNSLEEYLSGLSEVFSKIEEIKGSISDEKKVLPLSSELSRLVEEKKLSFIMNDLPNLLLETKDGISRIAGIVRNLRSFSSPRKESPQMLSVNECIENALKLIWSQIRNKVELMKDYGDLPRIKGYPTQLCQVFMNLLMNSAQAIEKRGTIMIATRRERDEIIVKVKDTGVGIPQEQLPRIFEPFFTTRKGKVGIGLGLSIVYRIIERHNGRMEVESKPGRGTTFTLYFPLGKGKSNE